MIQSGLVSITFRKLKPAEIVALCQKCGLEAIEWGGDVHAPHGDVEAARQVLEVTRAAKLQVTAYGSYYRAGESEGEGLKWQQVLASAQAMQAPLIRVWAGKKGSKEADAGYFQAVVDDLKRICDSAEILVACEFHGGTVCDMGASARRVMEAVNHPHLKSLWQPANGASVERRLGDLREVKPWLANVHVFQWGARGGADKRELSEGQPEWKQYLREANADGEARWALLEFVRGDRMEQLEVDATTLRSWLAAT